MIYLNVDADRKPDRVTVEQLPGGIRTIRLADNVEEYRQEDAKDRKMYRFDEVVFDLPENTQDTKEEIEENFAKWWEYGQKDHDAEDQTSPDPIDPEGMTKAEMQSAIRGLQKQNAMLEECLMEMSEIVYA